MFYSEMCFASETHGDPRHWMVQSDPIEKILPKKVRETEI